MTQPVLEVSFGARSEAGPVRRKNEDSFLTVPPVFLVADGMGGHDAGEVASRTVVDSFLPLSRHQWLPPNELVETVEKASTAVRALATGDKAPGSTLTGVGLTQQSGMPCWLVFNIGDSRTFLLRDANLLQISVDHSARGTAARAANNVITRALGAGMRSDPVPDQWLIPAETGDRILLCSDGLTNELTPQLITAILMSSQDPRSAAEQLVEAAVNAGGHDNVTAVVVFAERVVSTAAPGLSLDDSTADDNDDTIPDEIFPEVK